MEDVSLVPALKYLLLEGREGLSGFDRLETRHWDQSTSGVSPIREHPAEPSAYG